MSWRRSSTGSDGPVSRTPGVSPVVLRPSRGRRLAKLVANLALADLVGEAAR